MDTLGNYPCALTFKTRHVISPHAHMLKHSTAQINKLTYTGTHTDILTVGRCMMELLEVTVCSPSPIMAISVLSSEPSARLLTDELWELALMDMEGTE